jgi:hypothetical protein
MRHGRPPSESGRSDNVQTAPSLLIAIIAMTPVLLIHDGTGIYGLLLGLAAIGVAFAALAVPAGETTHLQKLILPPAILAAVPAAWIVAQMVPLPFDRLTHPIWHSAATAFGRHTAGSISIDIGATALAPSKYISAVGVLLLATLTAADRRHAKWVLYALTAATAVISLLLLWSNIFDNKYVNLLDGPDKRAEALDAAAFGLILSVAVGNRIYERREMRLTGMSPATFTRGLAVCVVAFALSLAAVILGRSRIVVFAACYGIGAVLAVAMIRRLTLRLWGLLGFAAIAVVGLIGIAATSSGIHGSDVTLTLASESPGSTVTAQRIVSDTPLPGTGAGTYAALVPIYRTPDDDAQASVVPTAAAAISIELGRPMLWYTFISLGIGALLLLQGALRRGRDSFYPAAGAACLIASSLMLLGNSGLLGSASGALAAAMVGIAVGQSRSRQA